MAGIGFGSRGSRVEMSNTWVWMIKGSSYRSVSQRGRVVRVDAMTVEDCRWTRNRRVGGESGDDGEGEKGQAGPLELLKKVDGSPTGDENSS